MNPAVKAAWVANLRSGAFEQGRGALNAAGTYCCIGVLAETMIEMGFPLERRRDGISIGYIAPSVSSTGPATGMLHRFMLDLIELDLHKAWELANLNDTGGPDGTGEDRMSFSDIADRIEETL